MVTRRKTFAPTVDVYPGAYPVVINNGDGHAMCLSWDDAVTIYKRLCDVIAHDLDKQHLAAALVAKARKGTVNV